MMRILFVVAIGLVGVGPAFGQEPQETVSINDLSAPITPAFVLLDLAPTSIAKPDNPRSFVMNAIQKVTSSDSGFPKDVAMQITPYWMKVHRGLTFDEYQNPGRWQAVAQTFAISVATSPIAGATKDADPLGTNVALGFSLRPWNGRPNPKMAETIERLNDVADVVLNIAAKNPGASDAEIQKAIGAELGTRIQTAAKQVSALNAQRVGFFLTLAGGQVWSFAGDDTQNGAAKRTGAWATAAYRTSVCPRGTEKDAPQCLATIDSIGVVRYLHDRGSESLWDVGAKIAWNPTGDFSASFEMLRRFAPEVSATESTDNSNRTAGILEYRINDGLSVFGTFGQDFKKVTGETPLLSLIGLNVGLGKKPEAKTPDLAKKVTAALKRN